MALQVKLLGTLPGVLTGGEGRVDMPKDTIIPTIWQLDFQPGAALSGNLAPSPNPRPRTGASAAYNEPKTTPRVQNLNH